MKGAKDATNGKERYFSFLFKIFASFASSAVNQKTNMTEIKVPSVGESISEVEIGEWLKKEGDTVSQDETLVLLDSAKTTVELPSPASGVITKISIQTGEVAAIGDIIGVIDDSANGAGNTPTAKSDATSTAAAEPRPEWEKPATKGEEKRAKQ